MRVAHVMAGARHGGAELFFERLAAAQHRTGTAVLPVVRTQAERAMRLAQAGVPPAQLGFGGALDVLTRPRLLHLLRGWHPEVVVAWMNRAARHAPRGDWVLAGRLGGYYDLGYYERCDHLIGNTRALRDWMLAQGVPSGRAHHLPNFAPDLGAAAPARLPVPEGAPVVLAMGRLHRNKGFDLLLRALPLLPEAHLVIAGEGPERSALLRLAEEGGVADRTHLLGWREDSGALLAAATVLCCPSRHEPLGNVVLEGFSAARPVVAAAAAGPRELIRDGEDGLLVPLEDPAALARALGAVLRDRGAGATLAANGRTRWEREHAEAPVLRLWAEALGELRRTPRGLGPVRVPGGTARRGASGAEGVAHAGGGGPDRGGAAAGRGGGEG